MVGCEDAIKWVEELPESDMRVYVLRRMAYEFDKDTGTKPRFHKGIHGRKYDYHTCGHCGATVVVPNRYCAGCGFFIDWKGVMG